jgi:hypothetical protein
VLSEKLTFGKNSPIWVISLQRSENLRTAKAVKSLAFPSNARNVALLHDCDD